MKALLFHGYTTPGDLSMSAHNCVRVPKTMHSLRLSSYATQKKNTNKYKFKQLNKLKKYMRVGMVGPKSTQTRVVGISTVLENLM